MNKQTIAKNCNDRLKNDYKKHLKSSKYQDNLEANFVLSLSCSPKKTEVIKKSKKELLISTSIQQKQLKEGKIQSSSCKNSISQNVKGFLSTKAQEKQIKGDFFLTNERINLTKNSYQNTKVSNHSNFREIEDLDEYQKVEKCKMVGDDTHALQNIEEAQSKSFDCIFSQHQNNKFILPIQTEDNNKIDINTSSPPPKIDIFTSPPLSIKNNHGYLSLTGSIKLKQKKSREIFQQQANQENQNQSLIQSNNSVKHQPQGNYPPLKQEPFKCYDGNNNSFGIKNFIKIKEKIEGNTASIVEGSLSESVVASTAINGSQQIGLIESGQSGVNYIRHQQFLSPCGSILSSNAKQSSNSKQMKAIQKENQETLDCVESKRESQFSLLESIGSGKKNCSNEQQQSQKIRELKTKYHLRDAIQRQELQKLQAENRALQLEILNMEKEISLTRSLRPLEINHLKKLEKELCAEKEKYLCLQSRAVQYQSTINMQKEIISNSNMKQKPNQCCQNCLDIPTSTQALLLKRIEQQDDVIYRLSEELVSVSCAKKQLEETLKNILLNQQLKNSQFSIDKDSKYKFIHSFDKQQLQQSNHLSSGHFQNSESLSFDLSQQKPSTYIGSTSLYESSNLLQGPMMNVQQVLQQNGINPTGSFFIRDSNPYTIEETEKSKDNISISSQQSNPNENNFCSPYNTQNELKEGFIFGPPRNISICSKEEQLKNQDLQNEKVVFLECMEDITLLEQSCRFMKQELNDNIILPTKQKLEQDKNILGEQSTELKSRHNQQPIQENQVSEQFVYNQQKQEIVINADQLKWMIQNYQKQFIPNGTNGN